MKSTRLVLPLLLAAAPVTACGGDDEDDGASAPVVARYAELVRANYAETLSRAEALKTAVDAFVAAPSEPGLVAARTAWIASREPFGQTEVYRFYGGPIDDDDGPEGQINAWPVNEAHIDYVKDDAAAGIINNPQSHPTIDKKLIANQNQKGAEDNVSSGYHAIEFLLWGQDFNPAGPGVRPYTDYLATGGTASNGERRGTYLREAAALLVDDLKSVADEWAPSGDTYAVGFVGGRGRTALTNIMNGLYRLAALELRGERLQTGYDEKEQEQEHSCFSDTTKTDFQMNILGVENVYLGRYGATDGPGVDELVRARDAAVDGEVKATLAAAKSAIDAIPTPYDQAILGADASLERMKVKAAIDALAALGQALLKAADRLGVTLDTSAL